MTDQAKILKLCEFEGFRMTITDFQRGAESENKRLLPIIHALLADRERLHKSMPEFANGVHANLVIQLTEARAQAEKLAEALSDWVKLDPRDATTEAVEALALYAKWKAGG